MLVSLDVATIALLGFSGSVLAILIHVLLIVGLLRGKRWARIWMLIALGFSLTLFGWFSVSQDDWAGALLFLGLFGPVALLLTGTSTRKRLTLGFAIFGVTLIWVVASNLFTFDVHTLAVGDCYDYPRDAGGEIAVRNLPKAKCADWHDVEVFAVFDYPAVGDEYPGESLVIEVSLEMCLAPFETFVGTPYEQTALDFHVLYPTLQSWASNGDHTVVCGVHRPDGEKLFGSVEGRGDAFDPQRGFEATVPSPRGPL